MSNKRYPEEFKIEAVKQVTERGRSAPDVEKRLGVLQPTLYEWMKKYALAPEERRTQASQQEELRRLKAELKRVTEERDILKKTAAFTHSLWLTNPSMPFARCAE
ncbi:transposase [Herbaspirillum sp. 1130]|nr:transposase [Herbaspirillum sp. 1130]